MMDFENKPMNFIARFNMPKYHVPVRAYLHSTGQEMWDPDENKEDVIRNAQKYLIKTFDSIRDDLLSFDYVLAVLWGQSNPGCGQSLSNGNKMIDCFGYSGVSHNPDYWPGNPEVEGWVMSDGLFTFKNGIFPGGLTCEDATILIGKEGEYRRKCKDLKEFLNVSPVISGIDKIVTLKYQGNKRI
jgi:hypothetical protein